MAAFEQFEYFKSDCLDGVTALRAQMTKFAYPRHSHEEYSFGLTLSGDQHFFSQGEFHKSTAGHMILFNPEDVHDGSGGADESLQYVMLYIAPTLLHSFLQSAGLPSIGDFRITDPVLRHPAVQKCIFNLARYTMTGGVDPITQEAELFDLAILLNQKYGLADEVYPTSRVDSIVLKAQSYIRENAASDITLDDLSHAFNISKFHFLRLFRQQLGITPYQYVLSCRLNQAQKALEKTDCVDDVVFDFGFSDLSHFNRRFKSLFGVTPTRYKKSLQA